MIKSYSYITPETNIMLYTYISIIHQLKKKYFSDTTHTLLLKGAREEKSTRCLITRLHNFAFPLTSGRFPWGKVLYLI